MDEDPRVEHLAKYLSTEDEWLALHACLREAQREDARRLLAELDGMVG